MPGVRPDPCCRAKQEGTAQCAPHYEQSALAAVAAGAVVRPAGVGGTAGPVRRAPQITDATGDGHHTNTDVTGRLADRESAGRLQAVIQVNVGLWAPAHEDSDRRPASRCSTSWPGRRATSACDDVRGGAPPTYDHGTWTRAGGFATAGATAGAVTTGAGGDGHARRSGRRGRHGARAPVRARPTTARRAADRTGSTARRAATTPDGTESGADFVARLVRAGDARHADPDRSRPTAVDAARRRRRRPAAGSVTRLGQA